MARGAYGQEDDPSVDRIRLDAFIGVCRDEAVKKALKKQPALREALSQKGFDEKTLYPPAHEAFLQLMDENAFYATQGKKTRLGDLLPLFVWQVSGHGHAMQTLTQQLGPDLTAWLLEAIKAELPAITKEHYAKFESEIVDPDTSSPEARLRLQLSELFFSPKKRLHDGMKDPAIAAIVRAGGKLTAEVIATIEAESVKAREEGDDDRLFTVHEYMIEPFVVASLPDIQRDVANKLAVAAAHSETIAPEMAVAMREWAEKGTVIEPLHSTMLVQDIKHYVEERLCNNLAKALGDRPITQCGGYIQFQNDAMYAADIEQGLDAIFSPNSKNIATALFQSMDKQIDKAFAKALPELTDIKTGRALNE